ncbi:peptide MFS transporter [Lacticaseibacillus parakribbianus]|uniref:peptide MFS transporter n=1 Tax=Lacticaseibacillus parakribbianus TaxID=2970927 RepID=UPI0021CB37CD|nr:peptide MFS transporter [Lacticaseibacillus parakribbianus]
MQIILKQNSQKTFLGHPRGLLTLSMTEFWERFSYYGMRAILIYYMYYAVAKGGLGFDKPTALSIMSIYGSLVYLSSTIGGFISDRLLGSRKTVFWGGILIMLGHIVLSLPMGAGALFASIGLIVLGTGLLKPNVSEMVGSLYPENDLRRDAGFSIFVMGINFGSLIAPLVVPWLQDRYNFHVGFSVAAIGMAIGLIFYVVDGRKYINPSDNVAPDPLQPGEVRPLLIKVGLGIAALAVVFAVMAGFGAFSIANVITVITVIALAVPITYFIMMLKSPKVSKVERSRVWAYIPLFIAAVLFWAIEEQGSVVLAVFAADQTQLNFGGFHILPGWFQTLNPLFILLYGPIFATLWVRLGKRQPSSPKKFAYGLVFTGLSYLVMVIPVLLFGTNTRVSPLWLVLSWAIVEIAEMLISPVGLSVTTKLAPKAFASQMMSMWFLADAAAQAINAQIVKLYTPATEVAYFTVVGVVTIGFAVLLWFLIPRIEKLMQGIN